MIILVCGPAGAGKTTVVTRLHERLEARGIPARTLDSDQFSRNTYEQLYQRVADADEHWIVAGTFYKRRWQERFAQLPDVFVVYLDATLETCLERNRRREDPLDDVSVHVVWHEFDVPDADVTVDVNERSPEEVVDRVVAALEPGLPTE